MNTSVVEHTAHSVSKRQIQDFEDAMLKLPQIDIETKHYIADGAYVREIMIPKGATVTGAVHLTETIDILVSGDITIVYDDVRKRLTGHGVYISKPGVKKVAYTHEDTVWMTVHAVDNIKDKTMDEIEKDLWVNSYDEYALLKGDKTWLLS